MTLSNVPHPVLAPERRSVVRLAHGGAPRVWIESLSRLGFVIRGLIYFIPGVFALEWALGRPHQPMTQAGTLDLIGSQPMGRLLLIVVAIGLAGYATWGVIRTVFDPLRRGHSPTGIALRIGYAMSAIAYLGLLVATVRLLTGSLSHVEQHQDWATGLLARPLGSVIVLAIGVCWIFGSGATQIAFGWRRGFARDLALEHMGSLERRVAIALGRVGLVSRGIVFAIIGVLLVAAALHLRASSNSGLDGVLIELAHQPFGRSLLAAAGLGLMAFGSYSAMCARWARMRRAGDGPGSSPSHPRLREVPRS